MLLPHDSKLYIKHRTGPEKSPRMTVDFPKHYVCPPLEKFLRTPLGMKGIFYDVKLSEIVLLNTVISYLQDCFMDILMTFFKVPTLLKNIHLRASLTLTLPVLI